jgi:hypothetical protein
LSASQAELFTVLAMIIVMPVIKLLIGVIISIVELIVPYLDARAIVKNQALILLHLLQPVLLQPVLHLLVKFLNSPLMAKPMKIRIL